MISLFIFNKLLFIYIFYNITPFFRPLNITPFFISLKLSIWVLQFKFIFNNFLSKIFNIIQYFNQIITHYRLKILFLKSSNKI
jgi:hypothetical protein